MDLSNDDTIAALASAPGPAARGIIRVSGHATSDVVRQVFRPHEPGRWQASRGAACHRGRLRLGASSLPVTVYHWPDTRSYTGEAMAEFHLSGSPPLLEVALGELYSAGVRPARPGEFTLRAFLAGRIDLIQAEAVLGVVDAHDSRELETALRQLAGGLSGKLVEVRAALLDLLADLEAGLDFVDEDIQFVARDALIDRISSAIATLEALLEQATNRMQSTGRQRVVLAGLPNAGKSTLFNALAGREAALVSEVKGTTRDYLSAALEWNRLPVELIDTAGWEEAADGIAGTAQALRSEQVAHADLVIWCRPANLDAVEREVDAALYAALRRDNRPLLVVATKCDLVPSADAAADASVAAREGKGLSGLIEAVADRMAAPAAGSRQFVGSTAARCRDSLRGALEALGEGLRAAETAAGDEIVALELRAALEGLGGILGLVYTDDVLDRIFSRFCIGK